ncbi:ROK family protein [Paenibacillus cisolokensis]|uniref:ROK family protein n=1 Tax=Paenibacillus cisolokensis TaxID=1658519 RepID=UPI003D2B34AD
MSDTKKRYAAGFDIGGTKILMFLADDTGAIIEKRRLPTPSMPAPEELFALLAGQLDESLAGLGANRTALAGIGIGLPGVVDYRQGTADNCTVLGWGKVDVRAGLRRHFECPVFVENDVKLSAFGEWWMGAAQGTRDFFMMAIGTGIGSAFMSDGAMVRGGNYAAGEIGYFMLNDDFADDFEQDYRAYGSLERLAGGAGIAARARQALSAHDGPTLLKDRYGATAENVRADQVFRAAEEGDALAREILRQPIRHLAMAIANAASLLNPDLIVIGGGVADSGSYLLDLLRTQSERLSPNPVVIVPAHLGGEAGAAGAVYLALQSG